MMRGVLENIAENDHQANYKMVLGIIRGAGKMTRADLYRAVKGRIEKRVLDSILSSLEEADEVLVGKLKKEGAGRPTTVYIAK